ncbi:hypothetical protein KAR34_01555 [bacterium]|nr:hypothetical protein [bacterium]
MNRNVQFSAPMRLSLAGGGHDLPAYYLKFGARLLAVALKTKIFVQIGTCVKHQSSPLTDLFQKQHPSLGVSIYSDVSPGAGLGGSGAVATALIAASHYLKTGSILPAIETGLTAYHWERDVLGHPVGFQDQLTAAIGGCVEMTAQPTGAITASKRPDLVKGLESLLANNFIIVETGLRRSAGKLLKTLAATYSKPNTSGPATVDEIEHAIHSEDGEMFGYLLKKHWESKCHRLPEAMTPEIDFIIQTALAAGADGAKAIGAGGGGFVLISGRKEKKSTIITTLCKVGCKIVNFSISSEGVKQEKNQQMSMSMKGK